MILIHKLGKLLYTGFSSFLVLALHHLDYLLGEQKPQKCGLIFQCNSEGVKFELSEHQYLPQNFTFILGIEITKITSELGILLISHYFTCLMYLVSQLLEIWDCHC